MGRAGVVEAGAIGSRGAHEVAQRGDRIVVAPRIRHGEVDLDGRRGRPRVDAQLGRGGAAVEQQRRTRPRASGGEPGREAGPERETGIDDVCGERRGGGVSAAGERRDTELLDVRHCRPDGIERGRALEQVRGVDGVTRGTEPIGSLDDAGPQPQC